MPLFKCDGQLTKAFLIVVGLWCTVSLLNSCLKDVILQKMPKISVDSVYDALLAPCPVSVEDLTKVVGYDLTHVPKCTDPLCDLNEDHRPVMVRRSRQPCTKVQDCVTVLVKTKHRHNLVKAFLKSLYSYYPGIAVVIADEIDVNFNNSQIPKEWLELANNSVIYLQVHAGVGYGRQMAAQISSLPYVLVADDDFVFTKNTDITKLLNVLSGTSVEIVSGAVNENSPYDGVFRVMESRATLYQPHWVIYPGVFYEVVPCHPKCFVVDIVKNFFLADREVLLRAGGWDTSRLYYEHEDFFLQMRKSRVTVAHCVDVIVNHTLTDRGLFHERKKHFKEWSQKLKSKWGFVDYYYCHAEGYNLLDGCEKIDF